MNATDKDQDAGDIAARVRQVHPGVERTARTLECEAFRFGLSGAGVDLGRAGALDFLPAASFDGVQDSRLFGSPEFRKVYPRRRDHERVKAEIARQERRVLRPGGVLIHSDNPRA